MRNTLTRTTATLLATLAAAPAMTQTPALTPGYDRFDIPADHRAGLLAGSVWYPSAGGGHPGLIGDNPAFIGRAVRVGARLPEGRHPLVLISHGSGGNMDGLGWLSAELAAAGALVVGVNHPGSTSGDSSPRRSARLDQRAQDLSAALDEALALFGDHVDPDRITALGFSMGGGTVLMTAGARFDTGLYADYCATRPAPVDCAFFRSGGVDPAAMPDEVGADLHDARLSAVIAIDPGLGYALTRDSLATIEAPVLLVNLGQFGPDSIWSAVDAGPDGADLLGAIPGAAHRVIEGAAHFSFLALCKPGAEEMLAEEDDDPICTDPAGSDRADIHARIIAELRDFLDL